jgi:hypothetical protein
MPVLHTEVPVTEAAVILRSLAGLCCSVEWEELDVRTGLHRYQVPGLVASVGGLISVSLLFEPAHHPRTGDLVHVDVSCGREKKIRFDARLAGGNEQQLVIRWPDRVRLDP